MNVQIIYFQYQEAFVTLESSGFKFFCQNSEWKMFFIVPVLLVLTLQATLSSNDCKRMQWIHSIETDTYRRKKDQLNEKEEIKYANMINWSKYD